MERKVVKIGNPIKLTADDIANFLKKDNFCSNYEVKVTEFSPRGESRRLDIFCLNRWGRQTRGYEIKISRADFLADKKWQEYLPYCNWFYFVAPIGVIKKEELPKNIGLIEIIINREERHYYDLENQIDEVSEFDKYYLTRKFTKHAHQLPDVSEENYIQILEALLIKLIYSKNVI